MKQVVNLDYSPHWQPPNFVFQTFVFNSLKVKLNPLMFYPTITWEVWPMCYGSEATGEGGCWYSISLHMHSEKSVLVKQQMPNVKSHRVLPLPSSDRRKIGRDRRPVGLFDGQTKTLLSPRPLTLKALFSLETCCLNHYWTGRGWTST